MGGNHHIIKKKILREISGCNEAIEKYDLQYKLQKPHNILKAYDIELHPKVINFNIVSQRRLETMGPLLI